VTNILNRYTQFLLQSRFRAAALAAILMFFPIVRWVGWAILSLVTLRKGTAEGGVVLMGIVLSMIIMGVVVFNVQELPAGASVTVVLFSVVGIVLTSVWVWILSNVLRQYATWSSVLRVALWTGLGLITIAHIAYADVTAWWMPLIKDNLVHMQASMPEVKFSPAILERIAAVMTGGYVAFTLLAVLFSVLIARWQQARLYNPGGLRQELVAIRLGKLEVALAIVMALWIVMGDKVLVIDLLPVISLIFVLAGLSVAHWLMALLKKPWIAVVVFYVVWVLLFRYMMLVLISLALLDGVVNIRERLIKR
jgi:hypothetical protein